MATFYKVNFWLVKEKEKGFTLVELLITILIFSTLVTFLFIFLNPLEQIQKGQDAQREHDLKSIQAALDTYLNDTGCYPTSLVFGQQWKAGGAIYMAKVPQDGACNASQKNCYRYEVDTTSNCPQWNILFANLTSNLAHNNPCPLATRPSCMPVNYSTTQINYCIISGNLDCVYVNAHTIPPGT
ncbi:MAG TPA: type II secretion system protein [Patescibacteria group bacterium]|nr:type II secretion system protein [Patescibacteria group bacterium]